MADQSVTQRLSSLQSRIKEIETKKISAQAELEVLKKQHTALVEELKEKGITDIKDLPELIIQMEEQLQIDINLIEAEVGKIEKQL